ncbi:CPBP family intramembrane glutamic endopeptidase [Paenibacillus allorhizosphaerae]|uniref:CAAX prenyl protease 2/Lysostaphin resistance protein A-like domain-containing protein n=1 Tax=Paenibacillus allorhizosphaerae TaxID=2849866 RepID=A0ABM8VKN5_9BACL|nr:CPBP family intramembrane glutamic endopeptidase [Paenibacillus allorhizosphaerae]CAG7647336.1 hypothetical protein PAECIP111802_03949 [Paenibacillus allorhizosphaerae]
MQRKRSEPSLLLLAVLGLIMYLGVIFISPFMEGADRLDENNIDKPSVTKQQAADAALKFAESRFRLSSDVETSTLYQSYTTRSGYLQKEHLYDDYLKKYGKRFPLDYYEVEINDRASGMNYFIAVNYNTLAVIGFERNKPAAAKTNSVSPSETNLTKLLEQTIAEMGYNPAAFVVEQDSSANGSFMFKSKSESIGDAKLALVMKVESGQTTAFRPAFSIPGSYGEWKNAQDDKSALMTRISMLVSLMMTIVAIWIVIRYRKEIGFSKGLILTLLFLAVYIVNNFNMMPAFRTTHGSGPTEAGAIFYLWFVNIFVFLMGLSTYFTLSAGRHMWLDHGWSAWPVWKDQIFGDHVRTAMIRGYMLCLFLLGLQQVMLFTAGEAFDVWAVSDPADSVYNMVYPALFPLMAWAAAISEEAVYRLFGIALFLKLTRNRFLAVLLPSVIWAASHTQYPIYPVYTRLVEVTVIGLIFGWAFLRYGFLTVIFAHAAMDSILMGLSLMYMGEPLQVLTGIVYLAVPALIGWLLSWLHRTYSGGRYRPVPR